MTTDEALYAALDPLFPGAAWPETYPGKELTYVTWNHWTIPEVYAEGLPAAARHRTQGRSHPPIPVFSGRRRARRFLFSPCMPCVWD